MLPNTSETFRKQMFAEEAALVWALAATGCSVFDAGTMWNENQKHWIFSFRSSVGFCLLSWICLLRLSQGRECFEYV